MACCDWIYDISDRKHLWEEAVIVGFTALFLFLFVLAGAVKCEQLVLLWEETDDAQMTIST